MSMDPNAGRAETQQQKAEGQETFLSAEERAQLKRMMGHPTDYPKELGSWMREFLAVNPPDFQASTFKGKGVPRYVDRASAAAMTAATGAGEDTMYSYNLKAQTLSPSGQLRILFFFTHQSPDGSNVATIRIKLGSTTVTSVQIGTEAMDGNARLGTIEATIVNAGAYNAQYGFLSLLYVTESGGTSRDEGLGSGTVDLSQDQTLSITNEWSGGDSNDIIAPKYVAVEVFNPVGA